jgi:O-antigen ligase
MTGPNPIGLTRPLVWERTTAGRRPANAGIPWFPAAAGIVLATGSIVMVEPAPVDLGVVLLLAVGLVFGSLSLKRVPSGPVFLLLLFSLSNLVSMYEASNAARATWFCLVTGYLLLSWFLLVGLLDRYGAIALKCILAGYIFAGVLSAVLGTAAYLATTPYTKYLLLNGRPRGLFKDPNVYGPYLVPIVVCALAILSRRINKVSRFLFWLAILLISTIGVFLSFSRASWINLVVTLGAFFLLQIVFSDNTRRSFRHLTVGLGCTVVLAGSVIAVGKAPQISHMIATRIGSGGLQSYDSDRFATHRRALESVIQHPLGIGPGQSELVFQYAAHSLFYRLLAENGLLGFISFSTFLLLCFMRSLRLARAARSEIWRLAAIVNAACLLGTLVNSAVVDTLHWRHMWILLAIPWVSTHRIHEVPNTGQFAPREVE